MALSHAGKETRVDSLNCPIDQDTGIYLSTFSISTRMARKDFGVYHYRTIVRIEHPVKMGFPYYFLGR